MPSALDIHTESKEEGVEEVAHAEHGGTHERGDAQMPVFQVRRTSVVRK